MSIPKTVPPKARAYVENLLAYAKPRGLESAYLFGSSIAKSKVSCILSFVSSGNPKI